MAAIRFATLLSLCLFAGTAEQALAQDAAQGEDLFRTRCGSCHSLEAGQNRLGPSLAGVVGRTAGSVEGARYSPALKASGIVWDEQSLDSYLASPRQMVAGTTMTVGVPNATQRGAIIAYLDGLPSAD